MLSQRKTGSDSYEFEFHDLSRYDLIMYTKSTKNSEKLKCENDFIKFNFMTSIYNKKINKNDSCHEEGKIRSTIEPVLKPVFQRQLKTVRTVVPLPICHHSTTRCVAQSQSNAVGVITTNATATKTKAVPV